MIQRSVLLEFPAAIAGQPIVSRVVRRFDVEVNNIQATITPEQDGRMFAIVTGEDADVLRALEWLRASEVRTTLPVQNLVWHEGRCTHCGACIGQCAPRAFSVDPATARVVFAAERCVACDLCVPACAYGALEALGHRVATAGEV